MNKIFLLMLSFLLIPIISVASPVASTDSTKCDTINVVSDSTASILHFDASLSHIDGALSKRDKQFTSALSRLDYNKYRLHHAACVALPVAVSGLALSPIDNWVASQVQTGMPNFGTTVDDYLQYAPFAAQGIMALCGVDGSSGGLLEVITADALSISMMAAAVYGLKYTVSRTRPNGEDDVSFPSGHTAKAFLGATLLAHEYGHISPWIPIAGYSVATATGVLRVLNNYHYVSDVLVGAAIGILTAELGYWAKDAIFKRYSLHRTKRMQMHNHILRYY
ncbi:MAG: phosphatase PAP2 family protein [Bacteroidaceae bacterium]|nr:phosphatase PAP2 family protein [Bacteroidaceae bacterium]